MTIQGASLVHAADHDIAKGIIESHRGRIWVESEGGARSQFSFLLPSARAAA